MPQLPDRQPVRCRCSIDTASLERNSREQATALEALRPSVTCTAEERQALRARLAELMERHGIEMAD